MSTLDKIIDIVNEVFQPETAVGGTTCISDLVSDSSEYLALLWKLEKAFDRTIPIALTLAFFANIDTGDRDELPISIERLMDFPSVQMILKRITPDHIAAYLD